MSNPTGVM